MQHLTMEELARLVDEAPADGEAVHLEACDLCRAELEGLRAQTEALGRLPVLAAPRHGWARLEGHLRAEGTIAVRPAAWGGRFLKIAASVAIFVAGGTAGALLRGAPADGSVAAAPARTATEAEAAVRRAEAAYLDALTRYAELSGSPAGSDPVNRLAALEGIVLTTRAALEQEPSDPVINGYHLTALSQREAILRTIGRSSDAQEWF